MAARPTDEPAVTAFTGQLLFWLWRAHHVRTEAALRSVGLMPATFAVLNVVASREGVIQQELCGVLGIDPSTMVSLIDQLEADRLAVRRPSERDRRAREVAITARGGRTLARARELAAGVEDDVLAGLDAAERRRLTALLHRALEAIPPQPPWTDGEPG